MPVLAAADGLVLEEEQDEKRIAIKSEKNKRKYIYQVFVQI